MGRRDKTAAPENSSSGEGRKRRKAPSDDDAEANEDLSLKIVQKSIQRAFRNNSRDSGVSEVTDLREEKKREKRRRKKNDEKEVPASGNVPLGNGVSEVKDLREEKKREKRRRKKNDEKEVPASGNVPLGNGVSEVTDLKNEERKKKKEKRAKKGDGAEVPWDSGVSEVVMDLKEEDEMKREKRRRKKSNERDIPAFSNIPQASKVFKDLKEEKKDKRKKKTGNGSEVPEVLDSIDIDAGFRDFSRDMVDNVEGKENLETDKSAEVSVKSVEVEANPVVVPDNTVLKKLLRGPRYFDPPDSNWASCYNCGEEGHTIANCTSAKRKKPCFVCGSFEHNAKQCTKGRECFICKQRGHRAKDCTEKYTNSKLCLRCGDLGHEMFSCRNDYSLDDIKDMQCYVCRKFGHLCCVNYSDSGPTEVTCYRCGLSGHTGLACMASYKDNNNTYDAPFVASSCYKCGVEGHFARECTSSVKISKSKRESSTPRQRSSKKIKDHTEPYSAPHNLGKSRKEKKPQFGEFASPSKPKPNRSEYSDDYYYNNQTNASNWRSPVNSSHKRRDMFASPKGNYARNSHSSKRPHETYFDDSPAGGSSRSYQRSYSASRFGYNYGKDSGGRNNDWW